VYGDGDRSVGCQIARYRRGLSAFSQRYGPGPVWVFRAPGRINLIGGHTDYNHGYVLPVALDRDIVLYARPRLDTHVKLANVEPEFPDAGFQISATIPHKAVGHWANYAQGPAQLFERELGPGLRGYDALIDGGAPYGIPRGAGLSSSSALTVSHALALVHLNGLDIESVKLADACGRAEWYVGTRGGIMDQFISILGRRNHALFLDCRPQDGTHYVYEHVPIPDDHVVLVIDSGVHHRNTGPLFNRRVAEGRIGVRLLRTRLADTEGIQITHLRDLESIPWEEIEPLLPEEIEAKTLLELGIDPNTILDAGVSPETDIFTVRRRCRHVISENHRVLASVQALRRGNMAAFVEQLRAAHASARDNYEVSIPEIEALVDIAASVSSRIGYRLTGAGWGGCLIALTPRELVTELVTRIQRDYERLTSRVATVFECRSAAGAGLAYTTTL
jgi:galactokinase